MIFEDPWTDTGSNILLMFFKLLYESKTRIESSTKKYNHKILLIDPTNPGDWKPTIYLYERPHIRLI